MVILRKRFTIDGLFELYFRALIYNFYVEGGEGVFLPTILARTQRVGSMSVRGWRKHLLGWQCVCICIGGSAVLVDVVWALRYPCVVDCICMMICLRG